MSLIQFIRFVYCDLFHSKYHERLNVRVLCVSVAYDYRCSRCGCEGAGWELMKWKL